MSTTLSSVAAPGPPGVRYRYLLGAMQQLQITMTVRAQCIPEEVARLPEVIERWRRASARMQELATKEVGAADQIQPEETPAELKPQLEQIEADSLFQASFSAVPTTFKVVEIDRLVAPQREVNLDYVETLRGRLRGTSLQDLIEFCLAPRGGLPEIRTLQSSANEMIFSSRSLDLRFLGGFPKPLEEGDIRAAHMGGQPAQVISLLVGFGASPINVWAAGRRLVLNNGFHRTVAIRTLGVQRMPVVVQNAANPDIEFPDQILGLSKGYLLQHPRPVLVKDFFDDALTVELHFKPRMKTVKVAWGVEPGVVPIE